MTITIINDCSDTNALGRLGSRTSSLFNAPVVNVGVNKYSEIEAAAILIDVIDSYEGREGVILVNVAPRHNEGKSWENGTPFCYFHYRRLLIVSTFAGYTLSLVKKLKLIDKIQLVDIPTVVQSLEERNMIESVLGERIINSQFRSFDFEPRLAKWINDGVKIPNEDISTEEITDIPQCITFIDNFGNAKTSILAQEIGFKRGKSIKTAFGELRCFGRLKDVQNGEKGLIIGSSGINDDRFIELVVQGGDVSKILNISVGDLIY